MHFPVISDNTTTSSSAGPTYDFEIAGVLSVEEFIQIAQNYAGGGVAQLIAVSYKTLINIFNDLLCSYLIYFVYSLAMVSFRFGFLVKI